MLVVDGGIGGLAKICQPGFEPRDLGICCPTLYHRPRGAALRPGKPGIKGIGSMRMMSPRILYAGLTTELLAGASVPVPGRTGGPLTLSLA